ncbi:hypothetical protein Q8W71_00320 [Methylobacterium sp. NEAU 140]|uniref:helix-turn-helix transcriptional regulator n=1 Tax=Methylobacterium sp. NEAU 140 TaxID=3064945 RepID=UPI002734B2F9|nr:hypothetical protein [Methylobacterium sp. NEAU 140]MDP4021053.1 hypothetical protein [Methylobacterium sp. NEAU 140]
MPDLNDSAPKHLPRILAKADAAAYCGLTEPGFDTWVKTGKLPKAMKGTRRWDIVALDQAIDRLSGVSRDAPPKPSALAAWLEQDAARQAGESGGLAAYIEKRKARKAAEAARQAEADRVSVNPAAQRRHKARMAAEAAGKAKEMGSRPKRRG